MLPGEARAQEREANQEIGGRAHGDPEGKEKDGSEKRPTRKRIAWDEGGCQPERYVMFKYRSNGVWKSAGRRIPLLALRIKLRPTRGKSRARNGGATQKKAPASEGGRYKKSGAGTELALGR
jgi:hypothetical protein